MERAARTDITPMDEAHSCGAAAEHRAALGLCDDPGMAAGMRAAQERGYAHIRSMQLSPTAGLQKLTQHCKALILQAKYIICISNKK